MNIYCCSCWDNLITLRLNWICAPQFITKILITMAAVGFCYVPSQCSISQRDQTHRPVLEWQSRTRRRRCLWPRRCTRPRPPGKPWRSPADSCRRTETSWRSPTAWSPSPCGTSWSSHLDGGQRERRFDSEIKSFRLNRCDRWIHEYFMSSSSRIKMFICEFNSYNMSHVCVD